MENPESKRQPLVLSGKSAFFFLLYVKYSGVMTAADRSYAVKMRAKTKQNGTSKGEIPHQTFYWLNNHQIKNTEQWGA